LPRWAAEAPGNSQLAAAVAQRKLACWKTEGSSETGEGYFFARADLEALRPAVEEAV
jgi:hypothetical protein